MKITKLTLAVLVAVGTVFTSCSSDDKIEEIVDKLTEYKFTRDGVSTVDYSEQTILLKQAFEIGAKLSAPEDPAITVDDINNRFKEGTNFSDSSLNGSKLVEFVATSSHTDFDTYISGQINDVFASSETASEGVAGSYTSNGKTRYFNEKGLEYSQAYYKGLIGAFTLDQIVNVILSDVKTASNTVIEGENYTEQEHLWDQAYGFLYGISEDDTTYSDRFLGHYLEEIQGQENFKKVKSVVDAALISGRQAIVANNETALDAAIKTLRTQLSIVPVVRGLYYLQNARATAGTPDSFHALSEGYGFIHSLQYTYNVATNKPYFTAQEVASYIAILEEGNGFYDLTTDDLVTDLMTPIYDKIAGDLGVSTLADVVEKAVE